MIQDVQVYLRYDCISNAKLLLNKTQLCVEAAYSKSNECQDIYEQLINVNASLKVQSLVGSSSNAVYFWEVDDFSTSNIQMCFSCETEECQPILDATKKSSKNTVFQFSLSGRNQILTYPITTVVSNDYVLVFALAWTYGGISITSSIIIMIHGIITTKRNIDKIKKGKM